MRSSRSPERLFGRRDEREALDRLLADVRGSRSGSIVVHGEAGIGKTALLDYALRSASGCRIARATGVESEMELAFGGLHQLCAPFLDRADRLPEPQRDALGTVFGLNTASPPDRFLVGLAVLSLLADVAEERPLVCLVDDAQWLDQVSAQILAFVARRLLAEQVALVFAMRDPTPEHALMGLPRLKVEGLTAHDAGALLDSATPGPLDGGVRGRLLVEARATLSPCSSCL
jgi:predicted ATPase